MKPRSVLKCMIGWTPADVANHPTAGQVEVGPWPDPYANGWSDKYLMTSGACFTSWHSYSPEKLRAVLLAVFHDLVVHDGLDPDMVHRAFWQLKEFREAVADGDVV